MKLQLSTNRLVFNIVGLCLFAFIAYGTSDYTIIFKPHFLSEFSQTTVATFFAICAFTLAGLNFMESPNKYFDYVRTFAGLILSVIALKCSIITFYVCKALIKGMDILYDSPYIQIIKIYNDKEIYHALKTAATSLTSKQLSMQELYKIKEKYNVKMPYEAHDAVVSHLLELAKAPKSHFWQDLSYALHVLGDNVWPAAKIMFFGGLTVGAGLAAYKGYRFFFCSESDTLKALQETQTILEKTRKTIEALREKTEASLKTLDEKLNNNTEMLLKKLTIGDANILNIFKSHLNDFKHLNENFTKAMGKYVPHVEENIRPFEGTGHTLVSGTGALATEAALVLARTYLGRKSAVKNEVVVSDE